MDLINWHSPNENIDLYRGNYIPSMLITRNQNKIINKKKPSEIYRELFKRAKSSTSFTKNYSDEFYIG